MKKRRFIGRVIDGNLYSALLVCRYARNNNLRLKGKKAIRRRNIKKTYGITKRTVYYLHFARGGITKYYTEDKI